MIEQSLVNDTPEDIAHWLYRTEGLDKTKIGDYLGEK
jgi:cytohesin